MSDAKIIKNRVYLCVVVMFFITQSYSMHYKKPILIASNFDSNRGDGAFLEDLFKHDYNTLVSDHEKYPYYDGKGVSLF